MGIRIRMSLLGGFFYKCFYGYFFIFKCFRGYCFSCIYFHGYIFVLNSMVTVSIVLKKYFHGYYF